MIGRELIDMLNFFLIYFCSGSLLRQDSDQNKIWVYSFHINQNWVFWYPVPRRTISVFSEYAQYLPSFLEMGAWYIAKANLEFLDPRNPPSPAFLVAEMVDAGHPTWLSVNSPFCLATSRRSLYYQLRQAPGAEVTCSVSRVTGQLTFALSPGLLAKPLGTFNAT